MSDTPEEQPTPEAATAPADTLYIIRGTDGSERGLYPSLEAAQAAHGQLTANHDGITFTIHDRGTGEPVN